jgi:4-diphosphocytidyl-2-C-methyl-D-erythritol kinase
VRIPQTANGQAEANVCFKACNVLRAKFSELAAYDIQIHIEKRIPLAGGLGGSSTDGAAVLRGINQLLELGLSRVQLQDLAASFGSDTVFFASGYPAAIGRGRGELLEPLRLPAERVYLLLVNPNISLLAGDAYRSIAKAGFKNCRDGQQSERLSDLLGEEASLESLCDCLYNDLEHAPSTVGGFPARERLASEMKAAGSLGVLMSGSGSTMFAVFRERAAAEKAKGRFEREYPEYMCRVSSILT